MTSGIAKTAPRNVFIVSPDLFNLGGAQRVFHLLAQGLAERLQDFRSDRPAWDDLTILIAEVAA